MPCHAQIEQKLVVQYESIEGQKVSLLQCLNHLLLSSTAHNDFQEKTPESLLPNAVKLLPRSGRRSFL